MGKAGRPRKVSREKRDIRVDVYFSEDEYAVLYEKSKNQKQSLSRFCRDKCLSKNQYTLSSEAKVFITEMGKIGVNLNQFVKKVNSLKESNGEQAIRFLEKSNLKEIKDALEMINAAQALWFSINKNII